MQLIIDIKNENLVDKIVKFLHIFKDEGVEIIKYKLDEKNEKEQDLIDSEWNEEFAKKHWKEIVMNTHSADRDDDEYLYEAAARFYSEKYSD